MRLIAQTWPEVETYLTTSRDLLLPVGSVEQHGPTGLIGTDTLCADAVAQAAGERLSMLVAPPLWYGMSSHHMGFPGSATLRPSLFQAVLAELLRGFYQHGFRNFHVVNGHGGNCASIQAVFQELKHEGFTGATFLLLDWFRMPEVQSLARELYGDEEGSHATPSEVSLSFFVENIEPRACPRASDPKPSPWPLTGQEMRKSFTTGTMRSNPGLARPEHGKRVLEVATEAVVQTIRKAPRLS